MVVRVVTDNAGKAEVNNFFHICEDNFIYLGFFCCLNNRKDDSLED